MPERSTLGVLMPVFNGGKGFRESLRSCATAGLCGNEYEIVVVDNCSTDGATDGLPQFDSAGAPIHLFRNPANIGRVENWNRSVDLALELGFRFVTFLFAGDRWLPSGNLPQLLRMMSQSSAAITFAPFVISAEDGTIRRESSRFHVAGSDVLCSPAEFVQNLLQSGLFPLGPLQANIYRIDATHRPWFDSGEPTRTDVQATLAFVHAAQSPVLIAAAPYFCWREHAGRFHMSMGAGQTMRDYMQTFQLACARTAFPMDHSRAKARVLLNSLRLMLSDASPREWPVLVKTLRDCASRTPYRVGAADFFAALWSRFVKGRKLLQFG